MSKGNVFMAAMIAVTFFFSGCAQVKKLTKSNPFAKSRKVTQCANPRIDLAFSLFDEAKLELATHYEDRDPNHLLDAYHLAGDSMSMARSVKKCRDRNITHFYAMKNLREKNRSLQRVVRLNMRDEDPGTLIDIYRDQYDKVMPNDIK